MKKTFLKILSFLVPLLLGSFKDRMVWAHVILTDPEVGVTRSGWRAVDTPIGTLFHLVGDIVSLPFYFLGNLF